MVTDGQINKLARDIESEISSMHSTLAEYDQYGGGDDSVSDLEELIRNATN